MEIKQQSEFPLLEEFKKHFQTTKDTIFAYDDVIYSNNQLSDDLIVHEMIHHKQQKRDGLKYWVRNYLEDHNYRLQQELEAYREQLKSIKDRNHRARIRLESAKSLSSALYGNICTYEQALNLLKV